MSARSNAIVSSDPEDDLLSFSMNFNCEDHHEVEERLIDITFSMNSHNESSSTESEDDMGGCAKNDNNAESSDSFRPMRWRRNRHHYGPLNEDKNTNRARGGVVPQSHSSSYRLFR